MATDPHIGTKIKRARERKRWTQRQLASALRVDRKTVDNWENGRTSPRSSLGALQAVLGITLDDEPGPGIVPQDDWERGYLADPGLTDDEKRLLITTHRRVREELSRRPGSGPAASGGSGEPARRQGERREGAS